MDNEDKDNRYIWGGCILFIFVSVISIFPYWHNLMHECSSDTDGKHGLNKWALLSENMAVALPVATQFVYMGAGTYSISDHSETIKAEVIGLSTAILDMFISTVLNHVKIKPLQADLQLWVVGD